MKLDAVIKQLKEEAGRLKAAIAVLDHLQRRRLIESQQDAVQRAAATVKKKPKPLAGGASRSSD